MSQSNQDVFIGRQPIFDRRRHTVAYELLYRGNDASDASDAGAAAVTDDALATAQVLRRAFRGLGVATVLGPCKGFVNVDAEMLASRRIEALPPEQVVLELLETVEVDERVIARCAQLKRKGYRIALDDFTRVCEGHEPLLELADVVKVDVLAMDHAALAALVRRLRLYPARLLAEKVDSVERARHCLALGFDLFQGFLFGRPALIGA
jgi:EAL and modified HD-GYP domain-containing signal transduction protein